GQGRRRSPKPMGLAEGGGNGQTRCRATRVRREEETERRRIDKANIGFDRLVSNASSGMPAMRLAQSPYGGWRKKRGSNRSWSLIDRAEAKSSRAGCGGGARCRVNPGRGRRRRPRVRCRDAGSEGRRRTERASASWALCTLPIQSAIEKPACQPCIFRGAAAGYKKNGLARGEGEAVRSGGSEPAWRERSGCKGGRRNIRCAGGA